jgi:hypothetical protein
MLFLLDIALFVDCNKEVSITLELQCFWLSTSVNLCANFTLPVIVVISMVALASWVSGQWGEPHCASNATSLDTALSPKCLRHFSALVHPGGCRKNLLDQVLVWRIWCFLVSSLKSYFTMLNNVFTYLFRPSTVCCVDLALYACEVFKQMPPKSPKLGVRGVEVG